MLLTKQQAVLLILTGAAAAVPGRLRSREAPAKQATQGFNHDHIKQTEERTRMEKLQWLGAAQGTQPEQACLRHSPIP
jgi:hypothetical protein